MTVEHYFPLDAEYVFKVRFVGVQSGGERPSRLRQVRVAVRPDSHTVARDIALEKPERLKGRSRAAAGGRARCGPTPIAVEAVI